MKELDFEENFIEYLTSGVVVGQDNQKDLSDIGKTINESAANYLKTKSWKYEAHIKTTEQLWQNFKTILEQHNQKTLEAPLSETEFSQVKRVISDLKTPYQAGQFLYGLNGISEIEVYLDDGRHVFLVVFDQKQIGAGDTIYQVVNQIRRPAVIAGKKNRQFDVTLLINGLPIIQIEAKRDTLDVNEALNQMHQYADELQYQDIYSTLQILVGVTPNNVKYMANTTADKFNKDFAFNWQRQNDNKIIRHWKEFTDSMLSIPMAHQMATNYMILDGTKNKHMLKVMRPYQVYATQKVINGLKKIDFEFGNKKVGYIWHTTGSGKTITSFKTAWLASKMPNIDKVVFLVDRIALTDQTNENYRAYDPDATDDFIGSVQNTKNTNDLQNKLNSKGNGIIVTSVQKVDTLIKREGFNPPNKNIVFIVDEAHRSTGGESFEAIQKTFKRAAWVGYTGTPMFDETTKGLRTEDIFGELLHAYTIREAIVDRNVLGFKVDFETTIDEQAMKSTYLPEFYKTRYPKWTAQQIQDKIENLSLEDMDDAVEPSFYDENLDHVKEVVKDIFTHWPNRSSNGKYNALFTTHVGGGKASTPMAMMYFDEFERINQQNRQEGKKTLKVAITFSQNNSNNDNMLESNKGLHRAITHYNLLFNEKFGMDTVTNYTQNVASRLNKTIRDKQYLDLVIVVDQFLTGFDAPELNTLYVDRTLKGAGLIQAYSRTNRIADMQNKPWGRIVNYRWPAQNEKLMNQALAIYANKDSAILTDDERNLQNVKDGITAPDFIDLFDTVKITVDKLNEMTEEFEQLPKSEKQKDEMFQLLREYNAGMAKLKQYDPEPSHNQIIGFDYDHPDALINALGMSSDQEIMLTTVLTNELKTHLAKQKNIPFSQIDLKMTHIKDVKIDYDYLTQLIEDLLNQIHQGDTEQAAATQEKINQFANGLDDRNYATKIINAAQSIANGYFPEAGSDFKYPASLQNSTQIIEEANNINLDHLLIKFRTDWGITEFISNAQIRSLISRHRYGQQDLDDTNQITNIITQASLDFESLAFDPNVQKMKKIKYRKELRTAIYALADQLVENK